MLYFRVEIIFVLSELLILLEKYIHQFDVKFPMLVIGKTKPRIYLFIVIMYVGGVNCKLWCEIVNGLTHARIFIARLSVF